MLIKKHVRKIIPIAVIATLLFGGWTGAKSKLNTNNAKVKNVIVLIGDGMGPAYTSAYRYYKDDPKTKEVEETKFDPHLVGQQMTYPDDPKENITDSAASATSISSGIKTYNGAIAVNKEKEAVKTVLESAKEKGKSTGLVATSEITHATPAAFGAHNEHRKNMEEIADDYYDDLINGKQKVDVLLGGGSELFIRDDRDLTKEFEEAGYSYVTNRKELLKDNNDHVLGLFAQRGLPKMIDRTNEVPSLEEMTKSAIDRLKNNKDGFFLMVEGSQIDWAGHDNDIVAAMSEMEDFEKAFQASIEFAKKDKHTLVIATADHSTGGLSIGAKGNYNWFPEPIKAAKRTPDFMAEKIANGDNVEMTLKKYIDLSLTKNEIQYVKDAAITKDPETIDNAIESIFDNRSNTGWTTSGHTGEDVPIYAYGPSKNKFVGQLNNTDIAEIIFDIVEK